MEHKEPTIEERHAALAQHVTQLTTIIDRLELNQEKMQEMMQKSDKRISRLYSITLRIGADFAERLRKLERDDLADEDEGEL